MRMRLQDLTVVELAADYVRYAKRYYGTAKTSEYFRIVRVIRPVRELLGGAEGRGASAGEILRNQAVVLALAGFGAMWAEVVIATVERNEGLPRSLVLAVLGQRVAELRHRTVLP